MSKYKPGQKVLVMSNPHPSLEEMQAMVSKVCEVIRRSSDGMYEVYTPDKTNFWWFYEENLAPAEKTWDTLEVGDILVTLGGGNIRVLAVLGDVFLPSVEDYLDAASAWFTKADAKKLGWTIKQSDTPQPDTIEINGKKYRADEVTERLSELEAIDE